MIHFWEKNFQSLFDQNIWILIDSRHDMYTFVKIIEGIQFRKEKQRTIMITWRGRPYFWLWKNKKLQNEKTYFLSSNNKMQECDPALEQNYELWFGNLTHKMKLRAIWRNKIDLDFLHCTQASITFTFLTKISWKKLIKSWFHEIFFRISTLYLLPLFPHSDTVLL